MPEPEHIIVAEEIDALLIAASAVLPKDLASKLSIELINADDLCKTNEYKAALIGAFLLTLGETKGEITGEKE